MIPKYFLAPMMMCLSILPSNVAQSCDVPKIHSHNDYEQEFPFWTAYKAGARSIEVDIYLRNDTLYATHDVAEIDSERQLANLYLMPLRSVIADALNEEITPIQLLIDIKSDAHSTLSRLIEILAKYPDITSNNRVSLVISGNRPDPEEYVNYPDYIQFDYQSLDIIADPAIWVKVDLISLPFYNYSEWDGKKPISHKERIKIESIIRIANEQGRPLRFWATPDSELAWQTFTDLGLCFINTDHPFECAAYLKSTH